ncbi:hypothetical protein MPTK1_5g16080 [Marchantia polymorpha subsp. ruderalis]|uniref:Uncharacterized protein n=2 Tax=Marchantia polymorpha TaxID=3197 RepID=A0AAF6BIV3_MARPO|nr:hypothetical protein MARPO_0071s0002 [Marchantia polymorpha]BBN11937.1 hypothetical protein Mp_5g16080 [Marchantia polymorpha subsp. ruderalis]|eukprot:PTQ35383.1 hypothetical protein MARPO_0071s0002 [Marchantia polymorpha]
MKVRNGRHAEPVHIRALGYEEEIPGSDCKSYTRTGIRRGLVAGAGGRSACGWQQKWTVKAEREWCVLALGKEMSAPSAPTCRTVGGWGSRSVVQN